MGRAAALAILVPMSFNGSSLFTWGAQEVSRVPSLAKIYQPYFPIGAAVDATTLQKAETLLETQVSSLTAENDMKWLLIHPVRGDEVTSYNYTMADRIVSFAAERGMKVRGHTLVWHKKVPSWVFEDAEGRAGRASKEEALGRMERHITTVLAHFRGKVYCWDVVNEALSDGEETWRTDSPWFKAAGSDEDGDGLPDYIASAFKAARRADPDAKLFYNDYNIESRNKLEKAYALAAALKREGLIDGVGIQGHWSIWSPDEETIRRGIRRFASLGLDVQITEMDLSVFLLGDTSSLDEVPPALLDTQAERYGALFKMFREEASVGTLSAVTFWGITDDHTWLDDFPVKGRKDWPLPFDRFQQPKKAFWSLARW